MLATALHSPFITMALARKRLAFSTLKLENVLRSLRYHRAARRCSCATCRERFAWVTLNYMQYAPLLLARERLAFIVARSILQQPCAHRRSCLQQTSSALIVAHPIKHRAFIHYSSTLKLENFLHTRRCVSSTSSASVYRCSVC